MPFRHIRFFAVLLIATAALFAGSSHAAACELKRPVMFGGLDWDSNAFHTAVARIILERGYGCKTDVLPGSALPLLTGHQMRATVNSATKFSETSFKPNNWEQLVVLSSCSLSADQSVTSLPTFDQSEHC